jgi:hypothetical protein
VLESTDHDLGLVSVLSPNQQSPDLNDGNGSVRVRAM